MATDLHEPDLRAFLDRMAREMPTPAEVPPRALRNARTKLVRNLVVSTAVAAIALAGAVAGLRSLPASAPNRPADDQPPPGTPDDWPRFDSPAYGYSISIPPAWTFTPTTIPWTSGEAPRSDIVQANVQVSSTTSYSFNILLASIAIPDRLTDSDWIDRQVAAFRELKQGVCGDAPPAIEPIEVDGVSGRLATACNNQGWEGVGDRGEMTIAVVIQRRGYLISTRGPAVLFMDLLRSVLGTIDLRPELAAEPPADAGAWRGIWPQTTRQEAVETQAEADATGVETYWQTDYDQEGIVARRFLEESLGWEFLDSGENYVPSDSQQAWEAEVWERYFIRCEPGATNPLYPDDPQGGDCAPTIDQTHYQQVVVRLEQPIRQGRGGIWVVIGWEEVEEYVQTVPPSADERAEALRSLEALMQARVSGAGAERYIARNDPISYLYSMTDGRPYGRFEIEPSRNWERPRWPFAEFGQIVVRLFPESGGGCVIQLMAPSYSGPIDEEGVGAGELVFSQFTGFTRFEGAYHAGSPECSEPLNDGLLPPGTLVP